MSFCLLRVIDLLVMMFVLGSRFMMVFVVVDFFELDLLMMVMVLLGKMLKFVLCRILWFFFWVWNVIVRLWMFSSGICVVLWIVIVVFLFLG